MNTRSKRYTPEQKDELKSQISDLRKAGLSYSNVGKELGISQNTVYRLHLNKVFGKKAKEQKKKKHKYTKRSGMSFQTLVVPETPITPETAKNEKAILVFASIDQIVKILGGSY